MVNHNPLKFGNYVEKQSNNRNKRKMAKGTNSSAEESKPSQLYQEEIDDEIFDDACDVGQFFLNPTWYVYVKLRSRFRSFSREQTNLRSVQAHDGKRSNYLHLQRPLYFIFLIGGWTAVFLKLYPRLWFSDVVSDLHPKLGYLVFSACLISWKLAASVGPGTITPETAWKFENYPYDNLLYKKNSICPTLQQRKLARSPVTRQELSQQILRALDSDSALHIASGHTRSKWRRKRWFRERWERGLRALGAKYRR